MKQNRVVHFFVGFEVLTEVAMNAAIFWFTTPRSLYVNLCPGGTYHFLLQGRKSSEQEQSVHQEARLSV
jgi:hypothetical protein